MNLSRLHNDVQQIARQCGRDPRSIKILAVSKTFPAEVVEEAAAAGQLLFGENRIQEGMSKIPRVNADGLIWHLVGHLQSNKARKAVELFDVIQTLDGAKIARKLSRHCVELDKRIKVMVQVNIGEEPQKTGFPPAEVSRIVALVDSLPNLELLGLMSIPPFNDDPEQTRPYFRALGKLMTEINEGRSEPLRELSMGMSGDYRIAIEEGSTIIRIGTGIFGPRGR